MALFDPSVGAARGRLRASAGATPPAPGGGVRGQFQFPHQDVPAAQSRTGRLDGAHGARRAGVPAIVNGSDASDHAAEYLAAGFTYVLEGEVEERIVEVARRMLSTADAVRSHELRGVAFREPLTGAIRRHAAARADRRSGCAARCRRGTWWMPSRTARRGSRRTAISRSTWFPAAAVRTAATGAPSPSGATAIIAARARLVAEEMLRTRNRASQPDHLWFADDIFALSQQWTLEFADAVEALRRANPVQDAIALRPDDAPDRGGLAPRRVRGSLDGRGVRRAGGARRDG